MPAYCISCTVAYTDVKMAAVYSYGPCHGHDINMLGQRISNGLISISDGGLDKAPYGRHDPAGFNFLLLHHPLNAGLEVFPRLQAKSMDLYVIR